MPESNNCYPQKDKNRIFTAGGGEGENESWSLLTRIENQSKRENCGNIFRSFHYCLKMLTGTLIVTMVRSNLSRRFSTRRFIRIPNKAHLSITGPDTKKLLQGLCTNDVHKISLGNCQANAFLTHKVIGIFMKFSCFKSAHDRVEYWQTLYFSKLMIPVK